MPQEVPAYTMDSIHPLHRVAAAVASCRSFDDNDSFFRRGI